MDRYVNQDGASFQPGKITLDVKFAAGSSGAVPTAIADYLIAAGIESMSLAATGLYTVHLSDAYIRLTRGTFQVIQATYDASHGCRGEVAVEDVDDASDPLVTFQCVRNDTGAAVAVTSGDIVCITLELQRMTGDIE
jgi:hypothetical protein